MKDSFILSNNSFNENEEDDNNSLFQFNRNSLFQKEDSSSNYFNNIGQELNMEEESPININSEYNCQNNNFENDFQYKDDQFPKNENILNKDFPLMSPIPVNEDDSYKMINNNNDISKEEILFKEKEKDKDGNSSGIGTEDTPLSTGGTGSKNQSKDNSINNSNIINNNNNKNNFISFTNENFNIKINNNKNADKTVLSKKRKQRIHLEDLNIDPEIIKYKKYQTIGDKVITSKNSVITDLDKKEIRAIRNRISAQKSRDRKKAEFLNLQMQVKIYQQQIEKQKLIIKTFENITCPVCKVKLNQIILENKNLSIPLEQNDNQNENEYLVLDENSILSDKKGSFLGKIAGSLIAVVCLIGIILCVAQGGLALSNKNMIIENGNQLNMRHLTSTNDMDLNENENNNISNIIIKDEDLDINVPLPIKSNHIKNYKNFNNLQLYHDKFGLDIYSFLKKRKKGKIGFLLKKPFYNDSFVDNSQCFETKSIEHNNYIIDNNLKNTLPVEANNIVIDNNLSQKIISLFIKDYETLQRFIDGRSLSLQEQIEIEAKNSEDGCVYLQMIIPKYKIDNYGSNDTYARYEEDGFFEVRGKIFAYNNYYENKVTTSF